MQLFTDYKLTIVSMGLAGLLLIIQLIIADLKAISSRHKAGYPIAADSANFLFRCARAHANTNESISGFGLLAVAGILSLADPAWLGGWSVAWLVSRIAHMGFYYANHKPLRSTAFGVSLFALLGLFATVLMAWLSVLQP